MKVLVQAYQANWADLFEQEYALLSEALDPFQHQIEHIGSTSVVGLSAKPIVDILIGMKMESDMDYSIVPIQSLGYVYNKKHEAVMPFRRFFFKLKNAKDYPKNIVLPTDEPPKFETHQKLVHIHLVSIQSEFWLHHLCFRDYLREHPKEAQTYGNLKIELAKKEWKHGTEYTAAKSEFIVETTEKALKFYHYK